MSSLVLVALSTLGGLLLLGAAYGYFWYAPLPKMPPLSAASQPARLLVGMRIRTYQVYVPVQLPQHAPLVLALHGSGHNGDTLRRWTGYELDLLADRYGFAVAYPDGYKGNWNDCRRDGSFPAKTENVDDVGFLRALAAQLRAAYGLDPQRVYAFGYSNGGQLAFRLAIEEPRLVAAIAVAGASLPTPESFICDTTGPTAPVLLVNGTQDPISPYPGGLVTLFGFSPRGTVRSARATAEAFAQRNNLRERPIATQLPHQQAADPTTVDCLRWGPADAPGVLLYTIHRGGHVVPQPAFRFPRLLGRTTGDLNMPAQAVAFFGLGPRVTF